MGGAVGGAAYRIWWREMLPLIMRHCSLLVILCNIPAEEVSELKGRCMSLDVLEELDHKFKITVKLHTLKKMQQLYQIYSERAFLLLTKCRSNRKQ